MPSLYARSAKARRQSINRLLGGIAFLFLLASMAVGLYLVRQSAENRGGASGGQDTVSITLQASPVDAERLRVYVMINTLGYNLAGFDIQGTLGGVTSSQVSIENSNQLLLDTVASTFSSVSGGINFRVVKFAPLSSTVATGTGGQTKILLSFLITKPTNNQVSVTINPSQSLFSFQGVGSVGISYPTQQTFQLVVQGQPTATPSNTGSFFIRKYNDLNGNGKQDGKETGLSWKFQWDSNGDNNWRDYDTFSDRLGEGGAVTLPVGTKVRIREIAKAGWTATSPSEASLVIKAGENTLMVFGNRQPPKATPPATAKPKPSVVPTVKPTPTLVPVVVPTSTPLPVATIDPNIRVDLLPARATASPSPTPEAKAGGISLPILLAAMAAIFGAIAVIGYLIFMRK